MRNIKKSIEEAVLKLRSALLNEADPIAPSGIRYDTDKLAARRTQGQMDASEIPSRAMQSAMGYADRLGSSDRLRADDIIKSTMTKGYAGAVDATFITDLDTRWANKKRISLDTPKTLSYDYIIQMLSMAYNTPDGQNIQVGGQQLPVTPGMKKNIYEGLLKMFDLQDSKGRWRWFIFGSDFPGVSMVPSMYRPKMSIKVDGTYDLDEMNDYIKYLNFWLKNGQLLNMMGKGGFYDKGFAYVLTAVRMKYNELKRDEGRKRQKAQSYDAYTDPDYKGLDLTDPAMMGAKKDLGGEIDTSMDLRYLGTKDDGTNPGHNSIQRFVQALKVDITQKSDLDTSNPQVYGMADHIMEHMFAFVQQRFGEKPLSKGYPVIPDLYKAKMSQTPKSLNDICRDPKYKDIYPNAYAAYLPVAETQPSAPTVTWTNWFKAFYQPIVVPELERITKEYIDAMDIEMDTKPKDTLDFKEPVVDDKPTYKDYKSPQGMLKRVNAITKKAEPFNDYDDFWNHLKETESDPIDQKSSLTSSFLSTFNKFMMP